ncbi:DUF3060 domain-containing protein [Mycobacterium sherrisii]|uniref:DUF3060 domain-containing protein n=1 Tax=Mycobacterium sherrisii TaxID=243061 RepID=A0A1E3SRE0_9MYCO|nr:DUF3060 domain-containing protein [Mycobacterium sherrisii]MCV7028421.1 DUF3060 domain-containing protein [Mycobacterium sherrisii]MEC4764107.1 DUF3060 domain-containing protein [Mycobacterium sherrisii]ODR04679.1 hypothetical protein BHQ21_16840 [Mycobacterium sherrisii]ORW76199.1 hypothetical protein AWC25_11930 [Mycobacterium sherrisii]
MESQDDPEKRIRDLERPLADTARASELGSPPAGGLGYPPPPPGPVPPPPPPSGYGYGGAPYVGAVNKSSSSNRVWWIVGTILVITVLAMAGIIAAFAAHQLSGVRSIISSELTTPSTAPLSTAPQTTTRSPRSSTSAPATSSAGPSTPATGAPGAPLDLSGIDENKTIACNDNAVTVSGINNTIVITGHCASLTVSGMKNVITIDSVDTIEASGMSNRVTFHSGAPAISNSGLDNQVAQG